MKVGEIISMQWIELQRLQSLVPLLRESGIDLTDSGGWDSPQERGTPAYVPFDADAQFVQRRMIQTHIRLVFVIEGDSIVGAVDLIDLVERADDLVWEGASGPTAD